MLYVLALNTNLNINTDSVLQEGYLCVHWQRKLLTVEQKELQTKVQQIIS